MFKSVLHLFFILFLLLLSFQLFAQTDSIKNATGFKKPIFIHVKNIEIEGNRRTKDFIILRQLIFKQGDSLNLALMMEVFNRCQNNLMNSGLFSEVTLNLKDWIGFKSNVLVSVNERWYTLPAVTFDIYDRNFNSWYVEHDHDIKRIQYGARFLQQNIRGRNEDLYLTALFGYAQKFDAAYNFPFINKKLNKGLRVSAYYSQQRNITYNTFENKEQIFLDNNKFIRKAFGGSIDLVFKPGLRIRHYISASYNHATITDTIAKLNENYFGNNLIDQEYISLRYSLVLDYRDIVVYPLKGNYTEVSILKTGIGILSDVDLTSATIIHQQYFHLYKNWFASVQGKIKYSVPANQPFYNQKAFGYKNDYVSGYEYYVIDGQSFALLKTVVKYKLFQFKVPMFTSAKAYKKTVVPFKVLLKIFSDAGYVNDNHNNTENFLANKMLVGYGAGVDIASAFNFALRFEYSFNNKGENGLFLHFTGMF